MSAEEGGKKSEDVGGRDGIMDSVVDSKSH